jgi:hypothetical protein
VDRGFAITTDAISNLCVTGISAATWGTPADSFASGNDIFVAKLNRTNGSVLWNTFLGRAGDDYGYAVIVGNGTLFIGGLSSAAWGSPIRAYAGNTDAVIAKSNPTNGALLWHAFLGGVGDDYNTDVLVDAQGNLYITGYSNATWGNPIFNYNAGHDEVIALLNTNGVLQRHGFIGGIWIVSAISLSLGGTDTAWNNDTVRQYDTFLTKPNPNSITLPIILK